MAIRRLATVLASLFLFSLSCAADIAVPDSYSFEVTAEGGRSWRIFVSIPPGETPEDGFAVIYAADGNRQFLTMTETVRNAIRRPDISSGAIVVGIGYPDGLAVGAERGLDLTPSPGPVDSRVRGGGANVMLEAIRQKIQPEIARRHDVDADREAWFGHSFGGLFGLYAYASRNDTFDEYFVASPSVWWDDRSVLDTVCRFSATRVDPVAPIHLTVGQYEQELPHWYTDGTEESTRITSLLASRGMVSNARELGTFLTGLPGFSGSFEVIPREDHGSVVPAAISRAVHSFLRNQSSPNLSGESTLPEWCPAAT